MAVAVENLEWNGFHEVGPIPNKLEKFSSQTAALFGFPELTIEAVDNVFDRFEREGKEVLVDNVHERDTVFKLEEETLPKENLVDYEDGFKGHNIDHSPVGVTNLIYLLKGQDYNPDLNKFKQNVHCSQEITVLYLNKEFHYQRHSCLTVTEINAEFIEELFRNTTLVALQKKELNPGIIKFFQEKDVSTKRCLVKCTGIEHGLALAQKWHDIALSSDTKKANNVFSNYQRPDRVASKKLVQTFKRENELPECASYGQIEEKAQVSFEVYGKEGFLLYASEKNMHKHTVFYETGDSIYFVKDKYLNAFGKPVSPKKRAKKSKVKRL